MKRNILIFKLFLVLCYVNHKTFNVLNPERFSINRWYEKSIRIGSGRISVSSKNE